MSKVTVSQLADVLGVDYERLLAQLNDAGIKASRANRKKITCSLSIHLAQRIQGTPDLTPSDITGVTIFRPDGSAFEFREGPREGQQTRATVALLIGSLATHELEAGDEVVVTIATESEEAPS